MFHGKFVIGTKVQLVAKTQIIIADVNVVDVNVTTRSKVIEEQVFKDRKPRKTKKCCWLGKRRAIEAINGGDNSINLENTNLNKRAIHIHGGMEHNLARYAKYYSYGCTKILKSSESRGKLIIVKEIFLDIRKQMLETSYTLNLGQLVKIALELKKYL